MNDEMRPDPPSEAPPDDVAVEHDPTLVYHPTELAPGAAEHRIAGAFRYALVVEGGPQAGLAYVLGAGDTEAGRGADTEIFLGDVTVSRRHATFTVDDQGLHMRDEGSTNGTYVNGQRRDKARLQPGDEVIIGKFHLRVVRGDG
jgi:hypothetical protein